MSTLLLLSQYTAMEVSILQDEGTLLLSSWRPPDHASDCCRVKTVQRRRDRKRKREEDEVKKADEEAMAKQAKKSADSKTSAVKSEETAADAKPEAPKPEAAPGADTEMKDAAEAPAAEVCLHNTTSPALRASPLFFTHDVVQCKIDSGGRKERQAAADPVDLL